MLFVSALGLLECFQTLFLKDTMSMPMMLRWAMHRNSCSGQTRPPLLQLLSAAPSVQTILSGTIFSGTVCVSEALVCERSTTAAQARQEVDHAWGCLQREIQSLLGELLGAHSLTSGGGPHASFGAQSFSMPGHAECRTLSFHQRFPQCQY